ncbi:MAG: GNAT family N-acetyltransferase [Eubacteriales bacterium]|nr:GNAT family N-acetyltransferase [Eubacteriales bacterium]
MIRFLNKDEYGRTRELFKACFMDDEFEAEYYAENGAVQQHRIAVVEEDGKIIAMLHLAPMQAIYPDGHTENTEYILCVGTDPEFRHRGYMDELMKWTEKMLIDEGFKWTFLVAVNKDIYRHLGYVYDWRFNKDEAELLFADEGLTDCSAKLLSGETFSVPERLKKL